MDTIENKPKEYHVNCSGKRHKISLNSKGQLIFHNHPEGFKNEKTFEALGGTSLRCFEFLRQWRASPKQKSSRIKYSQGVDPLLEALKNRWTRKICRVASKELRNCSYKRAKSAWAGGNHDVFCSVFSPPQREISITGYSKKVRSRNGKWPGVNSHVIAAVPIRWYTKIYKRGLAIVDGCFVLDIISETDDEIIVWAGKQSYGFNVILTKASILKKDERLKLKWIK